MPQIQNNTIEFKLRELHPAQEAIARDPAKHKRVRAGRRFGKSILCGSVGFLRALDDKQPIWWVAPTYKNTQAAWTEITTLARQLGRHAKVFKADFLVELPGGGTIQVVSGAEPDNMRSVGLGGVILDEAAYLDPRVYSEVLSPALIDYDGWSYMISTPRGYNWFYDECAHDGNPEFPEHKTWHYSSYDNPFNKRDVLDRLKRQMTASKFAQEILAEFITDATSVFRNVKECIHYDAVHAPIPGHTYVMGVDWGRKNDYTALSVWDVEERMEVALDRFTDISWGIQSARLQSLAHHWNVSIINAEQNSMGWSNIEALQTLGMPVQAFSMQTASKKRLVESFALALEQGTVRLSDHDVANDELIMYEEEILSSGNIRHRAPPGKHDDTVIARMLAYDLIGNQIAEPMWFSFF